MDPTLKIGDFILVNKLTPGSRIFNLFDAVNSKEVKIYRLPGISNIKHNDLVVFNFPYLKNFDSISFNLNNFFIKRCVALPGDTFQIRNAIYSIQGSPILLSDYQSQLNLSNTSESERNKIGLKSFPYNKAFNWSIINFGPLYIPKQDDIIEITKLNAILYKNIIEWEQKEKLTIEENKVLLGKKTLIRYKFLNNYYFMTGDNVKNSKDSRYWGFLPEDFIAGKVILIWKSINPINGNIRWDRTIKTVN